MNCEENDTSWSCSKPENSSNSDFYRTGSWVTILLFPMVVSIGLFGNIVTAVIYFARRMRQSCVNILLGGLAVSDAVMLFFGGTVMFPLGLYTYAEDLPGFILYLSYVTKYGYPLAVTAQMISIYVLMLITIERYLAVCNPTQARAVCTVKAGWWGLVICVLWSFLYNACRFFEFKIDSNGSLKEWLKTSEMYNIVYCMYLELIFTFIIPFIGLLLMNIRIVQAVNVASRSHKNSIMANRNKAKPKKFQTTWMTVVVILVFLGSNSLSFTLAILEVTAKTSMNPDLAFFLIDLSNLLVQLNSALNFIIYLCCSGTYRRHFKHRMICCCQSWIRMDSLGTSSTQMVRRVLDMEQKDKMMMEGGEGEEGSAAGGEDSPSSNAILENDNSQQQQQHKKMYTNSNDQNNHQQQQMMAMQPLLNGQSSTAASSEPATPKTLKTNTDRLHSNKYYSSNNSHQDTNNCSHTEKKNNDHRSSFEDRFPPVISKNPNFSPPSTTGTEYSLPSYQSPNTLNNRLNTDDLVVDKEAISLLQEKQQQQQQQQQLRQQQQYSKNGGKDASLRRIAKLQPTKYSEL